MLSLQAILLLFVAATGEVNAAKKCRDYPFAEMEHHHGEMRWRDVQVTLNHHWANPSPDITAHPNHVPVSFLSDVTIRGNQNGGNWSPTQKYNVTLKMAGHPEICEAIKVVDLDNVQSAAQLTRIGETHEWSSRLVNSHGQFTVVYDGDDVPEGGAFQSCDLKMVQYCEI
eukprot:TRINITY_DN41698_c0_g1_i1.p2 TRINITY_DN41698_c0_g1~~TRINITY_DN41698_c0_g1_i1.p2  ORF type:complete len:170 (-),score=10.14 TRINITY_DN41698_c0_g1_i1:40-549(-)